MNIYARAWQIWSVIALASRNRQILTYKIISQLTGMPRVGLGSCLEPIQSYCLLHGLPPLTILVIGEKSGMPGVGFIAAHDIPKAQQDVFKCDWLAHGCPTPETFEAAAKARPSNGVPEVPEE